MDAASVATILAALGIVLACAGIVLAVRHDRSLTRTISGVNAVVGKIDYVHDKVLDALHINAGEVAAKAVHQLGTDTRQLVDSSLRISEGNDVVLNNLASTLRAYSVKGLNSLATGRFEADLSEPLGVAYVSNCILASAQPGDLFVASHLIQVKSFWGSPGAAVYLNTHEEQLENGVHIVRIFIFDDADELNQPDSLAELRKQLRLTSKDGRNRIDVRVLQLDTVDTDTMTRPQMRQDIIVLHRYGGAIPTGGAGGAVQPREQPDPRSYFDGHHWAPCYGVTYGIGVNKLATNLRFYSDHTDEELKLRELYSDLRQIAKHSAEYRSPVPDKRSPDGLASQALPHPARGPL